MILLTTAALLGAVLAARARVIPVVSVSPAPVAPTAPARPVDRPASRAGTLPGVVLTIVFGVAFSAIAFGAQGGLQLGRTTVVEMIVTIASCAIAAAAIVAAPMRSRFWGGATLAILLAFAGLTAASRRRGRSSRRTRGSRRTGR